jgi:hypothetical protein
MTAPAYRSRGGWGYYYLNLWRAAVDLYRQPTPQTTLLAISKPTPAPPGHDIAPVVGGETMEVKWVYAGPRPEACTVSLDGRPAAEGVRGNGVSVDIRGLAPGRHWLRVTARGAVQRYRLLYDEDSLPLATPEPAWTEIPITVARAGQ